MRAGLSVRRACLLLSLSRSSLRYKARKKRCAGLKEALVSVWRNALGYRMAWAHVRRVAGFESVNVKAVHRLWRELKYSVVPRRTRKFKTGEVVLPVATGPGDVWCLDFLHETALNGQTVRILAVKDEYTRECVALEASSSFKAVEVAAVLLEAFAAHGCPKQLRSDNGPEFIAGSLEEFLKSHQTSALRIKPGSPWQNGFIESFNARIRAELLNVQVFCNLLDAKLHLSVYQRYYNCERPHSSLAYQTPSEFAARCCSSALATPEQKNNNVDSSKVGT